MVYQRCLRLLESYLKDLNEAFQANDDPPECNFALLPLDMIAALTRSLGTEIMTQFVSQTNLLPLLFEILKDRDYRIDPSKFALIGDMARVVPQCLEPLVPTIMPLLLEVTSIRNLFRSLDTSHNALWAIGEIMVAYTKDKNQHEVPQFLSPYLEEILTRTFYILRTPEADDLTETAAILTGRVGWICPRALLESKYQIQEIYKPFVISIRNLHDDVEKTEALKGFMCVLVKNPEVMLPHLLLSIDVLLNWHGKDVDLANSIASFLNYIKTRLGEQWHTVFESFPNYVKKRITEFYKC
jgi:transportin-1